MKNSKYKLFLITGLSDNDVQNQNIDGQRKIQLFLRWLHTESVEKITDEIMLHLGITSQCSLLKHLSEETKNKIRRFSQFIKSPSVQMQDLFQSVRKKLPAGCTGPYLEEDTLVEGIPHETRQKVCEAIWGKILIQSSYKMLLEGARGVFIFLNRESDI